MMPPQITTRRLPMRCLCTAVFAALVLATHLNAVLPGAPANPPPRPLGLLVREAKAIHLLKVEAVDEKCVAFKATTALKGKLEDVPFTLLQSDVQNPNDRFRADEVVLSFVSNEW